MSTSDSSSEMQHIPNAIQWNELITPDPDAAIRFYGEMSGWTTEKFPMPGRDYTMLKNGDKMFGGVMAPPQPGIPPLWLNYVSVADVQACADKAASIGATVIAGPRDIGEAGRIAVIQDPQGAMIGLHQMPQKE